MKKILLVIVAMIAFSAVATAQETPVQKNMFGGYFIYNRSDAQVPDNAVGGGAFVNRNLFFSSHPVSFQGDFMAYDDQAFAGTGHVFRGEVKARTPINLNWEFVPNQPSRVYLVGSASLEHQAGGRNFFNPAIGAGFKTGDDVLTEYEYVISPNRFNSVQGHKVTVQYTRPLNNNSGWNVFTRFSGLSGRFNLTPTQPENLMNVMFSIGISKDN